MKLKLFVLLFCVASMSAMAQDDRDRGMDEQGNNSKRMSREMIDLSHMGIINGDEGTKLIAQLNDLISKHNQALLDRFDKNKDGALDESETKAMNKWMEKKQKKQEEMFRQRNDDSRDMMMPPMGMGGGMGDGPM